MEVLGYMLTFAIGAALAGFSVYMLYGVAPGLHQATIQTQFDDIATAADSGTAVSLPLSDMTIACSGTELGLSVGTIGAYYPITGYCDFAYPDLSGSLTLSFMRLANGTLDLEVS